MKTKLLSLLCLLFLFNSCSSECELDEEILEIPMTVKVTRLDQLFAEATIETLPQLKSQYPRMFATSIPDSVWVAKLSDEIQEELDTEVSKAFPNFIEETDALRQLFQHIKYYFPEFTSPQVITVTSDVDYRNKVILQDDLLIIALDNYLGTDHHFYVGIQQYLKNNFRKAQLLPNVAQEYASQLVSSPENRTFLAYMIYYGKQLYLQDILLPCVDDAEKIGYSVESLKFAEENEDQVWRYFIERELLYDTNSKLQERFLNEGPFSKFYLEIDNETPAKLGQYIGWQIVRQYMEDNPASIKKMLITDTEAIFKASKYKPKK